MRSRAPIRGPESGKAREALRECRLCPRECRVDRLAGETGYCGAGAEARVAAATIHHGEEPPISGTRGSGAVFFSHCNMRCFFCQNYPISQLGNGREMRVAELGDRLLDLQAKGAHNINFVTPTPHVPHLIGAVSHARERGLAIPIVYNTNGYDSRESLALLDGTVDIYLPDAKVRSERLAGILSDTPAYPEHNAAAIAEMFRQVGPLAVDRDGIAVRGVLIRHLVLPGRIGETRKVLRHLREAFGREVPLALMGQYFPAWRAASPRAGSPFARKLSPGEYAEAIDIALELGLENTFIQDDDSEPVVRAR